MASDEHMQSVIGLNIVHIASLYWKVTEIIIQLNLAFWTPHLCEPHTLVDTFDYCRLAAIVDTFSPVLRCPH